MAKKSNYEELEQKVRESDNKAVKRSVAEEELEGSAQR